MKTVRTWMNEGPFTLALSSSFFGFFAHAGIAKAFSEQGFPPQKITGASAGGLIGATLASGLSTDQVRDIIFTLKREDFWDPRPGLGYLAGLKFMNHIRQFLPATFEETQIPLELAVFDILARKTKFLNSGNLPQAAVATCSVPFMFHPVRRNNTWLLDGGLFRKSGMNHEDPNERILCIFLESTGMKRGIERKKAFANLSPNHKILHFKNLPRVHFNALETGKVAYAQAFERAAKAFELPLIQSVLEC